ncbi:MAG: PTS sugar transporter subunit IIA [Candidatus Sumerlaeota bacterium]|nr:PTS sugar transporter subunit IIA [Candidatus Sumerlaeota bacterium]
MKLYSLLTEDQVLLNVQSTSLEGALDEMLAPFRERLAAIGLDSVKQSLLERERKTSTSIIEGVALPHARVDGLQDLLLALGAAAEGVEPVGGGPNRLHLIFLILTPLTKNTLMLQTLAAVARLLSSPKTRQALRTVKTPGRALKIIEESGVDVKKTLCANDIMNPADEVARPDMPLAAAMELLVQAPEDGVPVVNDAGELIGELAASDIIAIGLPKYMDLMENPVVLGNLEPFEQFFKKERHLKVADVARKEVMDVEPETPVVQIAHRMITERRRRCYVVRDGKLVGALSRKDIVIKVLML